jgi:hypothetical protein
LAFEFFELGEVGTGGGSEFMDSHGAYDPSRVASPEHQDGHPADAGSYYAPHRAVRVAGAAAAVACPNDGV